MLIVTFVYAIAILVLSAFFGLLSLLHLYAPVTFAGGDPLVVLEKGRPDLTFKDGWISVGLGIYGFGLIILVVRKRKSNKS
jgi:hypothetical protein